MSALGYKYTIHFNDGITETYERYDSRVQDGVLILRDLGNRYGPSIRIPLTSIKYYEAEDI